MEKKKISFKLLGQRKFLVIFFTFVLPLITLFIMFLSNINENDASKQQLTQKGLNMVLPDANFTEDKDFDKMSYYDKAASDSAKLKELMKNDPYYKQENAVEAGAMPESTSPLQKVNPGRSSNSLNTPVNGAHGNMDANEAKVYKKLDELNTALNSTSVNDVTARSNNNNRSSINDASVNSADVDRLEAMMQTMSQKDGEDPEIQQLNETLDKIMDIQHPDRVQEKLRQTSEERKGQLFAVSAREAHIPVYLLNNGSITRSIADTVRHTSINANNFFSFNDKQVVDEMATAIEAVVAETQTLVSGSTVKLCLINSIFISGILIPQNNFLYGTATLNGERLSIKINSIRYKNALFPVELLVYDMDGMQGIYIPGAITRDVAKQSTVRAIQDIGFNTLNPSVGVQAASAGIEAAKSLVSKKVNLIKVTVKAGYQVLLQDQKQTQKN